MSFFKLDNTELLEAPNFIYAPGYELAATLHEEYTYPYDGWYWFDTQEEAKTFFNIPEPLPELVPEPGTFPEIPVVPYTTQNFLV